MKKFLCALLVLIALPAHARLDLNALLEAARSHNLPQLARMAEANQGDILEMYPRYYWLNAQMTTLPDNLATDFLARHANTPLAERFRAEWLKELGRRGNWATFSAEYPKLESPSVELQCFQAQALLAQGDDSALNNTRPLWFTGQNLPSSCTPVFNALLVRSKLGVDDVWKRLRLALFDDNTDLAAQLATQVNAQSAIHSKQLTTLRASPEKGWPHPAEYRATRERALYALSRVARTDPERAAALLSRVETHWPEADRQYGWRIIGVLAAKKHHPYANSWISKGGKEGMDAESRAWSIRAGLRAGDWKGVAERIDALPERERLDPAWRYWRARAAREAGKIVESNQQFSQIAEGSDFYGLLAREELGTVLEAPAIQYRPSEDEIRTAQQWPGVKRAAALMQQNWRIEAIREWNYAMKGQSDQMLLAAAEYAGRQGWYDRAIYSADRTKLLHNNTLRYLTPYRDVVLKQAQKEGLDPSWVYGLMRQESRFISVAKSGVGASGLMQLMPATAKWVAKKMGVKHYDPASVNDIHTNISFGSYYLRQLWGSLNNSQVLASAGYNAGPGRARAWQGDAAMEAAVYIESIPFSETRDYVKKVMANAVHYSHILGSGRSALKPRIGSIPPKGGASEPDLP